MSGAEGRRQLLTRMPPQASAAVLMQKPQLAAVACFFSTQASASTPAPPAEQHPHHVPTATPCPQVLPARYGGAAELFPIDGAMTAWRRQQAATAAAEAASVASSASGSSSSGSGRRSRAASALRRGASATRSFVHHRMVRPVGGAVAGAARALRGHHAQLLARRHGMGRSLPPEQQRSLLAQVVLTHVLLVGLLLRMLQRVLLLRGPAAGSGAAAGSSGKQHSTQGSKAEPAGSGATSTEAVAAAPAGPADT